MQVSSFKKKKKKLNYTLLKNKHGCRYYCYYYYSLLVLQCKFYSIYSSWGCVTYFAIIIIILHYYLSLSLTHTHSLPYTYLTCNSCHWCSSSLQEVFLLETSVVHWLQTHGRYTATHIIHTFPLPLFFLYNLPFIHHTRTQTLEEWGSKGGLRRMRAGTDWEEEEEEEEASREDHLERAMRRRGCSCCPKLPSAFTSCNW